MASVPMELKAESAENAAGQGGAIDVSGIKELIIVVKVASKSGTITTFRVYLESSLDETTNYAELVADMTLKKGATAPGAGAANQRDAVNDATIVGGEIYMARFTNFGDLIRPAWVVAGTTPVVTFGIKAVGKTV